MGYRSDVGIVLKYDLIPEDKLSILLDWSDSTRLETYEGDVYVLFYISSIKWGQCDEMDSWIREQEDKFWKLVIIGEELDDNRYDGECDVFNLNLSRSVVFDEETDEFNEKADYDNLKADILPNSPEAIFKRFKEIYVRSHKDE